MRPTASPTPGLGDEAGTLQVVVMGVSGTGKSTVGRALAERLAWDFVEGDDLHPDRNIAKMTRGQALTDEDRLPWLERVRDRARTEAGAGRCAVITCSALRRSYRDLLRDGTGATFFLHLTAEPDVLSSRLRRRAGHFMPTGLLASQLATLEPLAADEDGAVVDVTGDPGTVVAAALRAVETRLRLEPGALCVSPPEPPSEHPR